MGAPSSSASATSPAGSAGVGRERRAARPRHRWRSGAAFGLAPDFAGREPPGTAWLAL